MSAPQQQPNKKKFPPSSSNNNSNQQQKKPQQQNNNNNNKKPEGNKNSNNNQNKNKNQNNNNNNNNKNKKQPSSVTVVGAATSQENVLETILQKPQTKFFNNNANKNEDAAEQDKNQKQQQQSSAPPPFSRQLDLTNFPRMTYKNSKQRPNVLKGLHLGQRKLLLSEIEFLSLALDEQENPLEIVRDESNDHNNNNNNSNSSSYHLMIYAGAAPGGHTPFLSRELFPDNVAFLLIDPAPFDDHLCSISNHVIVGENAQDTPGLAQKTKSDLASKDFDLNSVLPQKAGDITILRDYCTPELCERIRNSLGSRRGNSSTTLRSILFVSDIRVGDMNRNCTNAQATEIIMQDNELQKQCCEALQPQAAMLKFRPPFPKDNNPKSPYYDTDDHTPEDIHYYQGKVFFGVWAPKSSTETRLIVSKFGATNPGQKYNCKSFEEQLCYYNLSDRYLSDVQAEKEILEKYLKTASEGVKKKLFGGNNNTNNNLVNTLSKKISEALYKNDLFQPLLPSSVFSEADARLWVLLFIGCHLGGSGEHPLEMKKKNINNNNNNNSKQDDASSSCSEEEKMQKAIGVFEKLRKQVTLEKVVSGDNNDEVMKMFWKDYATATRLGECYCFLPWIHGKLVPRFHNSNHNNNNNNNKNNQNNKDLKKESGQRRQRSNDPRSVESTKKVFAEEEEDE